MTMATRRLMNKLAARDVELWADGETLRYRAPRGVMTPEIIALLREHVHNAIRGKAVMTWQEVKSLFAALELRELLICMLATTAGMRPGEIFGLKWQHVESEQIRIEQRVYRGHLDSPKTDRRNVALSEGLRSVISQWKEFAGTPGPEEWVFPSENRKTPLAKDNCWMRWIKPRLKTIDLDWVNFQVMRRTHSSLIAGTGGGSKIVADQLGHSVDVNLNVYSKTSLKIRKQALDSMESAVREA